MKRHVFAFSLLAALVLPAGFLVLRRPARNVSAATEAARLPAPKTLVSATSHTAAPVKSPDAAALAAERSETIRRFVETIGAWENAAGLEGDRLEEQLRGLITDENAEAILRALPARFHDTYVGNLLLARWASRERDEALCWLAAQDGPTLFAVNAVTKNWVVQDGKGLDRYLARLPASDWKSLVLESTGRDALANDDPEQAFHLLRAMNDGPSKVPLLANAVQLWAQWDPRSVVEEIDKLADSAARERLILATASGYARANPSAAADWLRKSFDEGPVLDRGLAGVMQAWAGTGDPVMAAQWVMKLPAGPTRARALEELIAAWGQENPETLQNWMSSLPDGPVRTQADAALGSLAALP